MLGRSLLLTVVFISAFLFAPSAVRAQQDAATIAQRLLRDSAVRGLITEIRGNETQVIEDQISLCQIPAPPLREGARAEAYRRHFEQLGLLNVRIDTVGNVLGERPGRSPTPQVVISAHLDTVFEEGTDVMVSREGSLLKAPGIGDDCRGLAVILGVVRALNRSKIVSPGSITFVGTVGEEGLGDLRGVRHLVQEGLKGRIDRFVSIDGAGLTITHIAVGSRRYRVTFQGPGGHSFGSFGMANPIHAVGRLIDKIAELEVPSTPRTTFNVGRIGGGTSINSIAAEAWMELDLRSEDASTLERLDANVQRAIAEALREENSRWASGGRLDVKTELVGSRPAAQLPRSAPIVQAAISVSEALGLPVRVSSGSTDANLPMSLNIPAIAIDGGGAGRGVHTVGEAFDTTESWKGTERAVLLTLALTQP